MGKIHIHTKITHESNVCHGRLKPATAALSTVTCEGAPKSPESTVEYPVGEHGKCT